MHCNTTSGLGKMGFNERSFGTNLSVDNEQSLVHIRHLKNSNIAFPNNFASNVGYKSH